MFTNTKVLLITTFYTFHLTATFEYKSKITYAKPDEYVNITESNKDGIKFESKFADSVRDVGLIQDNGSGNYGDLIYKYRENRDRLLVREVVIVDALSSGTQDVRWTVTISGGQVSSVRVLNFGRERAYCLRIDVAAGDVQTILRVGPYQDPRVLIEVYGY